MAREQETEVIDYNEWVEITENDVTEITFAVLDGAIEIRVSASEPSASHRGFPYDAGEGERGTALADISISTASRVWVKGMAFPRSTVIVDHA